MSKANDKKSEQLGMPVGTATQKLRKSLLFQFVQKCKEDVCYKCGKQIETVDELTIEHKQPWLDNDVSLFWDLNNIAYSHAVCNVPHRRYGGTPRRKIGEEGTAWCIKCKKFEPVENFYKDISRWSGLSRTCKYNRYDRPSRITQQ
jgi:hypothetical protein